MEIFQCQKNLTGIKAGSRFCEDPLAGEMEKEFATVDVFHDETEKIFGLERILQRLFWRKEKRSIIA